jgi:hypothetical protein
MNPTQKKRRRIVLAGTFLLGIAMWTALMFGQHGSLSPGFLVAMGIVAGIAWTLPLIAMVRYLGKAGPAAFWGPREPGQS